MWQILVVVENNDKIRMPKIWVVLPVGGIPGLISGLTGSVAAFSSARCCYCSTGPTWLFVSSMRLTPDGACAINLSRRFIASLLLKSISFMKYAG